MVDVATQVQQHAFTVNTDLDAEEVRIRTQLAAEMSRLFLVGYMREVSAQGGLIKYVIKGPGGLTNLMQLSVTWQEHADGARTVELRVQDYATVRGTDWYVIRVGSKIAPALPILAAFAARLRAELLRGSHAPEVTSSAVEIAVPRQGTHPDTDGPARRTLAVPRIFAVGAYGRPLAGQ